MSSFRIIELKAICSEESGLFLLRLIGAHGMATFFDDEEDGSAPCMLIVTMWVLHRVSIESGTPL